MAGPLKHLKRSFQRLTNAWRRKLVERSPPWLRRAAGTPVAWVDMLFVDHGIFRLLYVNQHRLSDKAWRSAQPAPHDIRRLAQRGLRTIINLRGERLCGSYWLEREACRRHGITLVNFVLRSRAAPGRQELKAARELLHSVEYPLLLHCKSGADRVGLMSVLYRFEKEGVPIDQATRELSLRYGHIRQAQTGILDYFFERYLAYAAKDPVDFWEWVETIYDPAEIERSFMASRWASRLTDWVLRRE